MVKDLGSKSTADGRQWLRDRLGSLRRQAACEGYGATIDALLLCQSEAIAPPDWIPGEVAALIREAATVRASGKSNLPRRPGRGANPVNAYFNRLVDYIRWDLVVELRQARRQERENLLQARRISPEAVAKLVRDRRRFGPALGKANELAEFAVVAEMLAGTVAGGSPHTIRDAFRRVERVRKRMDEAIHTRENPPLSYYLPSRLALELLGWDALAVAQDVQPIRSSGNARWETSRKHTRPKP